MLPLPPQDFRDTSFDLRVALAVCIGVFVCWPFLPLPVAPVADAALALVGIAVVLVRRRMRGFRDPDPVRAGVGVAVIVGWFGLLAWLAVAEGLAWAFRPMIATIGCIVVIWTTGLLGVLPFSKRQEAEACAPAGAPIPPLDEATLAAERRRRKAIVLVGSPLWLTAPLFAVFFVTHARVWSGGSLEPTAERIVAMRNKGATRYVSSEDRASVERWKRISLTAAPVGMGLSLVMVALNWKALDLGRRRDHEGWPEA